MNDYQYPVNYIGITQYYHQGFCLDFGWSAASTYNQPIYSIGDGIVYKIEKQRTGGNVLYIKHHETLYSQYAHLKDNSIRYKVGNKVLKGDQVALMGNTGVSTGHHLHFGLFSNPKLFYKNSDIDPFKILVLNNNQILNNNTESKYGNKIKEELINIIHTVVKGDTLSGLGKKYNVSWKEIYLNNKDMIDKENIRRKIDVNKKWLYIGQKILIK